jgi:hypothetical protein
MARAATSDEAESTAETDETALDETRRVEISSRGAPILTRRARATRRSGLKIADSRKGAIGGRG